MQGQERSFSSLPDTSRVQIPTELRSHTLRAGHILKDSNNNEFLVQC